MKGENHTRSVLTIVHVDYCVAENAKAHRTSRYEVSNRPSGEALLVVRRGQSFVLDLTLSRNYDPAIDNISMVFTYNGAKKSWHRSFDVTSNELHSNATSKGIWQTIVESYEGNLLKIKVTPAADAIIGKWLTEIDTKTQGFERADSFNVKNPFYVIFNPWCQEDLVYLENESERQEYVMEETGLIWQNNVNHMTSVPWSYAQFGEDILDCTLYLITNVKQVRIANRNNPIAITRNLSAAINKQNDNGVLWGNWSERKEAYSDGKFPSHWVGSQKILQQYYQTKTPVKYGQCWVFAGVLTTVCRALGLPCRPVTNYESGHDSENNSTIDVYLDQNGMRIKNMSDSWWNFHVWNEVWMKRPDLSDVYNGWQVIDATPQEAPFYLGPTSVVAVKQADLNCHYDTGFVYAEVNADKLIWKYDKSSQTSTLLYNEISSIGQNISTKAVGKWEREDITHTYKYPEKSSEERLIMYKALLKSQSRSRHYLIDGFHEVKFNLELKHDIMIGQPFSVALKMQNVSNVRWHTVSVILRVDAKTYTGRMGEPVARLDTERLIKPGQTDEVFLEVSWEKYQPRLISQGCFNISYFATVKETSLEYTNQVDFCVKKPEIVIELSNQPYVDEWLAVTARFTNPLPIALKGGKFIFTGPGLQIQHKLTHDVDAGAEAVAQFQVLPMFAGMTTMIAKFNSKELNDVNGYFNFVVQPKL
ncbi:annulin-like [Copidosoma floridanum]|uniref:annulin-like n=1 Tax=Copidosoma floridanum TaxID=29053 RepID=UPI0006C94587|nr:annulin-like [Copidosoma floridanum]